MIDPALFPKALLMGLAVAAPLGPIGALCITRTLERGLAAGLAGGFGTALADALYAAVAAAGFATFAAALQVIDLPLRILGGAALIWLGLHSLRPATPPDTASSTAPPAAPAAAQVPDRALMGTALTTFLLTLANPATILTFAAIFAGLGLAQSPGAVNAALVTLGVFLGSLAWWVLLSGGMALARHRLPPAFALWTARASAAVLLGFGLWAIGSALAPILRAG